MDARKYIRIRGANENNLKNIDVDIPRNELVVLTGLSGSGKSSLAFDTIYAEGQRRYMESLSSYARQFLGQMEKPDVESIEGLSPAISIDQKSTNHNPRSTVGTVTEIYDYFRLLYARVGIPHCPKCGREIAKQTVDQMVDQIMSLPERTRIQLLAPVVRGRKGTHAKLLEQAKRSGYVRVRIDGNMYELSEDIKLEKNIKHNIEIIVDRLIVRTGIEKRLTDSVENVLHLAEGLLVVDVIDGEPMNFSQSFSCPDCGISIEEIEPRSFSFNNPFGACPECFGLGYKMEFSEELMIPNPSLSINEGAIAVLGWQSCTDKSSFTHAILDALCKEYGFDLDTPFEKYPKKIHDVLIHGTNGKSVKVFYKGQRGEGVYDIAFEGLIKNVERRYRETGSESSKAEYETFMNITPCSACKGQRLKPGALAVTVADKNIAEVTALSIEKLQSFLNNLKLSDTQMMIGGQILKEISARIQFLMDVGLDYLTLARATGTLSGGEAQRIRLATQIGSGLVGVAYILDEPSIGLHQRDNDKLLATLKHLRDLGNSLIVVEHDEDIIRAADYLIDLGPDAGTHGGEVVYQGVPSEIKNDEIDKYDKSYTVKYLFDIDKIPIPAKRRHWNKSIIVKGARMNNLKGIDVTFPLNVLNVVTGVSGSGKSSLVRGILYPALKRKLDEVAELPGEYASLEGDWADISHVEMVNQNPIGKSSRSNPVTYVKAFDEIRQLFAEQPLAQQMGFTAQYFSFNTDGGRCETCKGTGVITVEMQFMADLELQCDACHGKRFKSDVLDVRFCGKNIYDVLEMTVKEAIDFFAQNGQETIARKLKPLDDVGLGYVKLGQSSSTLSGGENQRVKLAYFLGQEKCDPTLFIFDEPTTGLHFHDIKKLLKAFEALIMHGHSVIVIEHNLDVAKCADYIIDLGPGGGDKGGHLVFTGTPEDIVKCKESVTGEYLKMKM